MSSDREYLMFNIGIEVAQAAEKRISEILSGYDFRIVDTPEFYGDSDNGTAMLDFTICTSQGTQLSAHGYLYNDDLWALFNDEPNADLLSPEEETQLDSCLSEMQTAIQNLKVNLVVSAFDLWAADIN